jgi:hypothetical protein
MGMYFKTMCNDGTQDVGDPTKAPCVNNGGVKVASNFNWSDLNKILDNPNKLISMQKPIFNNGSDFSKQREIERQQNLAYEQAKLDAIMLEKNPNYNSLTDKVFGKQEGWSFTRAFRLGGYTILGVILGRYVAKNMGKSTNLGMVIGGVLPYVAYKLSLEYDKKQFSKQPQQAPKQPVDISKSDIELNRKKAQLNLDLINEILTDLNKNSKQETRNGIKYQIDNNGKDIGFWVGDVFTRTDGKDKLIEQYRKNIKDLGFTFLNNKVLTTSEYEIEKNKMF